MAGNTKVLVIGATGYIGQHIAKAAASEPGVTAFALVSKATEERATAERAAAVEKLRSTPDLNVLEVTCTTNYLFLAFHYSGRVFAWLLVSGERKAPMGLLIELFAKTILY